MVAWQLFSGNCRRGGGIRREAAFGEIVFGEMVAWKLFLEWHQSVGDDQGGACGRIWERVAAWKLLSGWRPVGVGAIKAAPAGWIWECVAAWKLFLEWRPVGWGTIKAAPTGGFGSVWPRGNCFRDGGQSAGGRSRRRLRVDLGACGRVEMCGKGVQGRVSTAGNWGRMTGKVQKGRKEVRFPAAEEVNWERDIAFCVSL